MNSIYYDGDPPTSGLHGDLPQGNGQEDLDFPLILYNPPGNEESEQGDDGNSQDAQDALSPESGAQNHTPYSLEDLCDSPYHHGDASSGTTDGLGEFQGYPDPLRPRIEITYSELHPHDHPHTEPLDIGPPRPNLTVPGYYDNSSYRGGGGADAQCLSPASSNSSTSWSEVCSPWTSPCVSPSALPELCPPMQSLHTQSAGCSPRASPTTSPRGSITEETFLTCRRSSSPHPHPSSRSASPKGKRTYDQSQNPSLVVARSRSPSPSPHPEDRSDPCGSGLSGGGATAGAGAGAGAGGGSGGGGPAELDFVGALCGSLPKPVPTKMVRATFGGGVQYVDPGEGLCYSHEVKAEPPAAATGLETFYLIPAPWNNQVPCSAPVASLPSLEWQLPSSVGQLELLIEVQPKTYHRAHYETEGSRGAVKAPSGGHPVVQLRGYQGQEPLALQVYIGTADERVLKPHAFYQVHRITGKTVTTSSHERIIHGTKVLEMLLDPKDNMRTVIDSAGILKLRNADIELRKGETDIGRKNTRVRLVFRVHVPLPGGQFISLQTASQIIECSQRSAHELPAVERQDVEHCSVLGGQQMILTGQNFTSDSKVVFTEKTHDGLQIWEAEATVDRDKSQASMLFVEIPPYRDHAIYHPAKVNFYVLNGRRKRSQPQHFTYTPLSVPFIKTEPADDFQFGQLGCAVSQLLGVSPSSRHAHSHSHSVPSQMPLDGCGVPGLPSHPHPHHHLHHHHQPHQAQQQHQHQQQHHQPQQVVGGLRGSYGALDQPSESYQLQCPVVYRQSRSLGSSPVLYQSILDMGSYAGARGLSNMPTHTTHHHQHSSPGGHHHSSMGHLAGVSSYGGSGGGMPKVDHHRVLMGNSFQEAASRFPDFSGSGGGLGVGGGGNGAASVQTTVGYGQLGAAVGIPRQQGHGHQQHQQQQQQGFPSPSSSTGPAARVTVKQEFLDHLDDVNDIIRKDMPVLRPDHT